MQQLFITGDSTTGLNPPSAKTGDKVSWSDVLEPHVDKLNATYCNRSCPGRSLRDYHHRGILENILLDVRAGDVIIACHGHLEKTPLTRINDRARGCLPGDGDLTVEVYDYVFNRSEIIHTFGWYIRQYDRLCAGRGITLLFLSPPVRNVWENGRVRRTRSTAYAITMSEVCADLGAMYVDFAALTENFLNTVGEEAASKLYLPEDITHTNSVGANVYSAMIAERLRNHESGLFKKFFSG